MRRTLESLREKTLALSLVEVIRRAIITYDFLWEKKSDGGKVIVRTESGDEEIVIL